MTSPYEVEILPSNVMCNSCKGIGKFGGSLFLTETCADCKGTGMTQREDEENDYDSR